MPGEDGSRYLETDVGLPELPLDRTIPGYPVDPNPLFGRVAYTHGPSLDQPLGIVRMNYGDRIDESGREVSHRVVPPFVLSPVWNERGQALFGVFEDGAARKCEGTGTTRRCVYLGWPKTWFAYVRLQFSPEEQRAPELRMRNQRLRSASIGAGIGAALAGALHLWQLYAMSLGGMAPEGVAFTTYGVALVLGFPTNLLLSVGLDYWRTLGLVSLGTSEYPLLLLGIVVNWTLISMLRGYLRRNRSDGADQRNRYDGREHHP